MAEEATNPFTATQELLEKIDSEIIIVDFHCESTSEKIAYGLYFDGKVDIIYGTHTHVQTNDAHIMEHGTAYISDLGMTGNYDATRTATDTDLMTGTTMDGTTWVWIILAVVGVVILATIWVYAMQNTGND